MTHGMTRIETDQCDVMAFEITDALDKAGMEALAGDIEDAFDAHGGGLSLLLRVNGVELSDFMTAYGAEALKADFRSICNLDRFAMVGAMDSLERLGRIFGALTPIRIRSFDITEEAKAWDFVGAEAI